MSAFLLRFKANYLENVHGYPYFSLWIPINSPCKDVLFLRGPNLVQKPFLYLVGTVLKLNNRSHFIPDLILGFDKTLTPYKIKGN